MSTPRICTKNIKLVLSALRKLDYNVIICLHIVCSKAKGRILKRVFLEYKACQIFRKNEHFLLPDMHLRFAPLLYFRRYVYLWSIFGECRGTVLVIVNLLFKPDFSIHPEKSQFIPVQGIEYLEFVVNLITTKISLQKTKHGTKSLTEAILKIQS